jgi:hypothetical protein
MVRNGAHDDRNGAHDEPECCSRWGRNGAHNEPEWVLTMARNTQPEPIPATFVLSGSAGRGERPIWNVTGFSRFLNFAKEFVYSWV